MAVSSIATQDCASPRRVCDLGYRILPFQGIAVGATLLRISIARLRRTDIRLGEPREK
jgi:hypothetical protein